MILGRRTAEGQLVITAGPPLSTDPRMAGFALKPTGEIYASGGQSVFTPADLFLNGEEGAWYDPSDLSTMFQDSAGTTPVTADGQPVGLILDKSGNGNHASQATAASRPLYKTDGTYHWLQFDGIDDSLSTGNIDFTGTDKMSVFSGVLSPVTATEAALFICETTASVGGFYQALPQNPGTVGQKLNGKLVISNGGLLNSTPYVLTSTGDLAAPAGVGEDLRINGVSSIAINVDGALSPFYGDHPLNVGMRVGGTNVFNGNLYSLIVRGSLSTPEEITETETWVNGKTGAY